MWDDFNVVNVITRSVSNQPGSNVKSVSLQKKSNIGPIDTYFGL